LSRGEKGNGRWDMRKTKMACVVNIFLAHPWITRPATVWWSIAICGMVLLCAFCPARADDYRRLLEEGNKLYEEGNFDEALARYREARIERPELPEVQYNIGSALYRQNAFEEAVEVYGTSLSTESAELEAHAYYNMGNALFRQQQYIEAIEAYKRSLVINSEDVDAKFNLELARKMLKEQMQPEQQEKQQQCQQPQKEEGEEQKQEQRQEQQGEKQQEDEQVGQQEQQPESPDSTGQQQQPRPQEGLTKEDAERILDALKEDERRLQKEKRRAKVRPDRQRGKDW